MFLYLEDFDEYINPSNILYIYKTDLIEECGEGDYDEPYQVTLVFGSDCERFYSFDKKYKMEDFIEYIVNFENKRS